eukprot:1177141-Karenia_brevis.AAC.1
MQMITRSQGRHNKVCGEGRHISLSVDHISRRKLTGKIKCASSVMELLILHRKHSGAFNRIHLSAFWIVLEKLALKDPAWLPSYSESMELLQNTIMVVMPQCGIRECANFVYGMARAGLRHQQGTV